VGAVGIDDESVDVGVVLGAAQRPLQTRDVVSCLVECAVGEGREREYRGAVCDEFPVGLWVEGLDDDVVAARVFLDGWAVDDGRELKRRSLGL
jgi:hypothetical protein